MSYGTDAYYAELVATLRAKYIARGETVARLIAQNDAQGILARADAMRKRLAEHLLDPALAHIGPLDAVSAGTLAFPGYTVERIRVRGAAGMIPMNLYLPARQTAPYPAVLVTMGHWLAGKAHADNQRLCANLALNGIAALIHDPVYQGERLAYREDTLLDMFGADTEDMWAVGMHMRAGNPAYMLGKNIGALFVHEARRALDYLCARPDIDASRIGACGQSGGGTLACYLAALDERIVAFSPVQCLSRLAITLDGGIGDCEQSLAGMSAEDGMEQCDLLWAALPKPVMHSAGKDDFFAAEGVYAIENEMTGVYRALGQPGGYRLCMADCGHEFSRESRAHVLNWFPERFLGTQAFPEIETEILPAEALYALAPSEKTRTPLAYYREMLLRARADAPKGDGLRDAVRALIRPAHERYTVAELARVRDERVYEVVTAHSRRAFCRLMKRASTRIVLVVAPGEFVLPPVSESVLYVTPWAMETAYRKRTLGYDAETCLFNAALVLGQHIACMRVREIIAALDEACADCAASEVVIVGVGAGAIPALLTAIVDRRVTGCALVGAPVSWDACFETETHFARETNIVPGLVALADLGTLTKLAGAVCVNPVHADRTPYTRAEIESETRAACRYAADPAQAVAQWCGERA